MPKKTEGGKYLKADVSTKELGLERDAKEPLCGMEQTDKIWFGFGSLSDLLTYCQK